MQVGTYLLISLSVGMYKVCSKENVNFVFYVRYRQVRRCLSIYLGVFSSIFDFKKNGQVPTQKICRVGRQVPIRYILNKMKFEILIVILQIYFVSKQLFIGDVYHVNMCRNIKKKSTVERRYSCRRFKKFTFSFIQLSYLKSRILAT